MTFLSARRAFSAGIIAAASVAAFVAPSAANAALPGHCKGTGTEGAGSSLQAEAQGVWDPQFNVNKAGCPAGPAVKYHSIGSGAGYKEWAVNKNFGTIGFVGTDNTVNQAEKETVENLVANKEVATSKLLTIPVLQGAVAIAVNLPENCVANSKVAPGRLALNQSTLEGIYSGSITAWSQLVGVEGTGNELTGAGCSTATAITPVVRLDGSGTTHIFKKFLDLINASPMASEDGLEHTWAELAEGGAINKVWPSAAKVKKATTETGTGVLKTVAETPGSVGYANLADARNTANGGFTGQSPQRFWVELENSKKEKTTSKGVKISRKYADPASNGDVLASAESNCKKTEFTNKKGTFPPPSVEAPWNEVTAKATSKTYALCGLTYDLVLTNYEAYTGGTPAEAQTVIDFENYVLNKKGGATDIVGHDYAPLPKAVVSEAQKGIELITG
jgi:ABC-type phosphate transport system substrate-binding protein